MVVRQIYAFALNGLNQKGGGVAARQSCFQSGEVVERDGGEARQQRPKSLAEDCVAIGGERAVGQPVKCMMAVNDTGAPCSAPGELYRRFDRLCTGVGKKCFVQERNKTKQAF